MISGGSVVIQEQLLIRDLGLESNGGNVLSCLVLKRMFACLRSV